MWSGGLSDHEVDLILSEASKLPLEVGGTFNNGGTSIRSSEVAWLNGNLQIQNILWRFVDAANKNVFHFDVQNICDIQYTEYHAIKQGHYDWHIDVNWDADRRLDRKISLTIQLSHPHEYEGGAFQFSECETPDERSKVRGTVLAFPSYLQHRVLPITKGTRKSLVAWFEGPRWR